MDEIEIPDLPDSFIAESEDHANIPDVDVEPTFEENAEEAPEAPPKEKAAKPASKPVEKGKVTTEEKSGITEDMLRKWAEELGGETEGEGAEADPGDAEGEPQGEEKVPAYVQKMLAEIAELKAKLEGPAKTEEAPAAPPVNIVDPISQKDRWVELRTKAYHDAGYDVTKTDVQGAIRNDLLEARQERINQRFEERDRETEDMRRESAVQAEHTRIKNDVEEISKKYIGVQSPVGKQILNWALADLAQSGEKPTRENLEKRIKGVDELVPMFIMERYGNPKKNNIRSLKGQAPRGRTPRPPAPKDYGKDFSALDAVGKDLEAARRL